MPAFTFNTAAGIQFGERNPARAVQTEVLFQSAAEADYVAPLQTPMGGKDDKAQPGNPSFGRIHLRLPVGSEAKTSQVISDLPLPCVKFTLAIGEQGQIVHVAQVGGTA